MRSVLQSVLGQLNFWRAATMICAGVLLNVGLKAAESAIPEPAGRAPISSSRQYWNLSAEEQLRPQRYRFECDIAFYDPQWKNLWIHDGIEGAYVAVGNRDFPFRAGQRVVVTGTFSPPHNNLSFENATVESMMPSRVAALSTIGQFLHTGLFGNQVVEAEGFVVRQSRLDPHHLHLTLSIEGETIFAYVLLDPAKPIPNYNESTVRVRAVYVATQPPDGQKISIELRIASPDDISVVHLLRSDPRFDIAVTPIGQLSKLPRTELVRVVGEVKAQEPGRSLRLRDSSGQVELATGQLITCAINEQVEAIGYPAIEGTDWRLRHALFRSLTAPVSQPSADPHRTLRVAAQVLELSREEADEGRTVFISGVVTWADPTLQFFYMQDASGGVRVSSKALNGLPVASGWNIDLKGTTTNGPFAPMVSATEVSRLGDLVLPGARQISLESALTGVEEAQWVEMRGYLRQVRDQYPRTELELTTSAGNFRAVLPLTPGLGNLEGSVIRLHGVCTAKANERRQLSSIELLVPSASLVQVEEAAPVDLFDQPVRLLATLGQFGTLKSFNRRVKVSGVVLHHSPGAFINIIEGTESLRVMSKQKTPLVPGDRIDAVGFLGHESGRPILRESVYRQTGKGDIPAAVTLSEPGINRPQLDGHLVELEATLIDHSIVGNQFRLTFQSENAIFEAFLGKAGVPDATLPFLEGSKLKVTGVYATKDIDVGPATAFRLQVRSLSDIVLITPPSALTRGRVLAFAGALIVGILLFVGWVVALRRRVQKQTAQIRVQLEREARLESELQRTMKLESLGILAGGIAHDFNNLLTVLMGNLSLAMMDMTKDAASTPWIREAERAVARARDLTLQLLTFAKGGSPIRSAVVLADIVREVAQFALSGSNVRCTFNIAPDLWPADVDKGQIGQVVQNIVINAKQVMPNGGLIEVTLRNETNDPGYGKNLQSGRYLKLTITDHGSGIAPENVERIFDPYFTTKKTGNGLGLATVYSIVKKHLGHITVESAVGKGTSFHIWLPAASTQPKAAPEAKSRWDAGRGRVLFMDDDEEIRRLGVAMLQRLGYEVTSVSDGSDAIREYQRSFGSGAPYDVVILDLTIPGGIGGREAMQQLVKIDPKVKAIVSSGYSNDQVLANFQEYGFSGIVSKPYETAALAQMLNELCSCSMVRSSTAGVV